MSIEFSVTVCATAGVIATAPEPSAIHLFPGVDAL